MLKRVRKSSGRGFSIIEIMVTIVIMAIIMGAATLNYTKTRDVTKFQTGVDNFIQQINQAQTEAKAYGDNPSTDPASGYYAVSSNNGNLRDYKVFLINHGISQALKINSYDQVRFDFNFNIPPISYDDVKENGRFKGVALAFGYEDPPKSGNYTFDMILPFSPNGTPYLPAGATGPTNASFLQAGDYEPANEFVIRMSLADSNGNIRSGRYICINKNTANVKTFAYKK